MGLFQTKLQSDLERERESGQQKMCHNYLGWRMVETLKIFYGPFRIR